MSLRNSAMAAGGVSTRSKQEELASPSGNRRPQASQEKQKKLLGSNAGHFSMVKALHLADLITEMNAFCGFMSILSSLRYCLDPPGTYTNIYIALALIPLGCFFDLMDGKVARWRGKSSLMGQELDSLADLISFGAAPASAAFALGLRTPLDTLALTFFVLCGLTRLARFNVTVSSLPKDSSGKSKYFEGFPIPSSHILVAAMACAVYARRVEGTEAGVFGGVLGQSIEVGRGAGTSSGWLEVHPIVGIFVAWGSAMISRTIHIPKP